MCDASWDFDCCLRRRNVTFFLFFFRDRCQRKRFETGNEAVAEFFPRKQTINCRVFARKVSIVPVYTKARLLDCRKVQSFRTNKACKLPWSLIFCQHRTTLFLMYQVREIMTHYTAQFDFLSLCSSCERPCRFLEGKNCFKTHLSVQVFATTQISPDGTLIIVRESKGDFAKKK